MKLNFKLEGKHEVEFTFSKMTGILKLAVDGVIKGKAIMLIGGDKSCRCNIANYEIEARIVQPIMLSAMRKRSYEFYVNNQLYKTYDHKGIEV